MRKSLRSFEGSLFGSFGITLSDGARVFAHLYSGDEGIGIYTVSGEDVALDDIASFTTAARLHAAIAKSPQAGESRLGFVSGTLHPAAVKAMPTVASVEEMLSWQQRSKGTDYDLAELLAEVERFYQVGSL